MKELKSLQELTDTIKKLYTSYDDINLLIEMGYEENDESLIPEIAEAIRTLEEKFNGEGRVLIRPSGTEPFVRVMIEGKDQAQIEKDAHELADLITKIML